MSYEAKIRTFWAKVKRTATCWIWTGTRKDSGYGVTFFQGRIIRSHRFAYELLKGPIPDGLVVDHLCRNRACVNPDHMELVTNRENILRGEGFTAQCARRTHCPRGHPYDRITNQGTRACSICLLAAKRARGKRWYAKKKSSRVPQQHESVERTAEAV